MFYMHETLIKILHMCKLLGCHLYIELLLSGKKTYSYVVVPKWSRDGRGNDRTFIIEFLGYSNLHLSQIYLTFAQPPESIVQSPSQAGNTTQALD